MFLLCQTEGKNMETKMILSQDGQYAVRVTTTHLIGESHPCTRAAVHPVKRRKNSPDDEEDSISYIESYCIDIGRCKNEKDAFQKAVQIMAERHVKLDMKNIIHDPPTIWHTGTLR